MPARKGGTYKIARDAITGKFVPMKHAMQKPNTTVVETFKRKKGK